MAAPNIMIAVPAYGGSIKNDCVRSLFALQAEFAKRQWPFHFRDINAAGISLVRNIFATQALRDPTFTHLLFVDSDMHFMPSSVFKMVDSGAAVIGAVYPRRTIDLQKLASLGTVSTETTSRALDFAVNFSTETVTVSITNGIMPLDGEIGMGLTLIRREALEKLAPTVVLHRRHGLSAKYDFPIHGFFDEMAEDGELLHEDYAFCRRWRNAGGSVSALVNETIGHIGTFTYEGRYDHKIRAGEG